MFDYVASLATEHVWKMASRPRRQCAPQVQDLVDVHRRPNVVLVDDDDIDDDENIPDEGDSDEEDIVEELAEVSDDDKVDEQPPSADDNYTGRDGTTICGLMYL